MVVRLLYRHIYIYVLPIDTAHIVQYASNGYFKWIYSHKHINYDINGIYRDIYIYIKTDQESNQYNCPHQKSKKKKSSLLN